MPSVYVIILNYQSYNDTIQYIEILNRQKDINLNILVVDNCSPNGSFEILQDKLINVKNVEVIKSEKNGGYAYGNNYGIKYIESKKFDYLIISNNDIEIKNKLLIYTMIEEYKKINDIAFIAPVMQTSTVQKSISAWKIPTLKHDMINTLNILKILFKSDTTYSFENNKDINKVECLPGSFFMSSKNIFYDINLFDEKTFLYGEERILAVKVKSKKLNNYLVQNLNYLHMTSSTISNEVNILKMRKYLFESRYYFHKNYMKSSQTSLLLFKLVYLISILETKIIYFLKRFI